MSYQKQNFANGEVLTASQLNHIENGIADVESAANATKDVVDKIIDPTLSVSGKAADAAKVGEAVGQVKDFINVVLDDKNELVPIYLPVGTKITFKTVDGSNFDDSYLKFYRSDKRDISAGGWELKSNISERTVIVQFATEDKVAYYASTNSTKKIRIEGCNNAEYLSQLFVRAEKNTLNAQNTNRLANDLFFRKAGIPALRFLKFFVGGIDSDGTITNLKYRVYSELFKVQATVRLTVDEGKRFGIQFYDEDENPTKNTGWIAGSYSVPEGSLIRIVVSNFATSNEEEAKYTADPDILPNVLKFINGLNEDVQTNTNAIQTNTNVVETFVQSKFVQGSIYNGVLEATNTQCISYSDYFRCDGVDIIAFDKKDMGNARWNIRCSFFDDEHVFVSQDGYKEENIFIVPENAVYLKISLSLLVGTDNHDISPADYTDDKSIKMRLHVAKLYGCIRKIYADNLKTEQSIADMKSKTEIPSDARAGYYSGEKITIKKNKIAYKKYMQIDISLFGKQSVQGCAQYNGLLFVTCNQMAVIAIFDLESKEFVGKITLTPVPTYHCNSMNFGIEKYADGDDFPLLYISMENIAEHKMIALRITKALDDTYSGEIKQTVIYPEPSESTQYYPNGSLDNDNGYLFVKGYTLNNYVASSENKIRVRKWAMPKLSDGDVELKVADALQTFDVPALTATQGEIVNNGKMLGCYGADWAGDKSIHVAMIDPERERMVTDITMNSVGYTQEPEAVFVWNDGMYILDGMGEICRLYFN